MGSDKVNGRLFGIRLDTLDTYWEKFEGLVDRLRDFKYY